MVSHCSSSAAFRCIRLLAVWAIPTRFPLWWWKTLPGVGTAAFASASSTLRPASCRSTPSNRKPMILSIFCPLAVSFRSSSIWACSTGSTVAVAILLMDVLAKVEMMFKYRRRKTHEIAHYINSSVGLP